MYRHIVLFKNVFSVILTSTIVSSCVKESNKTLANLNIIGGVEVPENENSQVRKSTVAVKVNSNSKVYSCSGVLIAPKVVLTAGHCTQNNDKDKNIKFSNASDYFVYFTTTIDDKQSITDTNKIQASKIIVHPNLQTDKTTVNSLIHKINDLAIIILSQNHPSTAIPAKLSYNYNISIEKGDRLTLAGYGSDKLKKMFAFVNIIYMEKECFESEIIRDETTCSGDSGGPAYYTKNGVTYLVGIISGNRREEGKCAGESLVVDLKSYKNWIEESIK